MKLLPKVLLEARSQLKAPSQLKACANLYLSKIEAGAFNRGYTEINSAPRTPTIPLFFPILYIERITRV